MYKIKAGLKEIENRSFINAQLNARDESRKRQEDVSVMVGNDKQCTYRNGELVWAKHPGLISIYD